MRVAEARSGGIVRDGGVQGDGVHSEGSGSRVVREFFEAMQVEAGETLVLVVLRDGKPVSLTLVAQ